MEQKLPCSHEMLHLTFNSKIKNNENNNLCRLQQWWHYYDLIISITGVKYNFGYVFPYSNATWLQQSKTLLGRVQSLLLVSWRRVTWFLKMVYWAHGGLEAWTAQSSRTSKKEWNSLKNGVSAMNKQVQACDSKKYPVSFSQARIWRIFILLLISPAA